MAENYTIKILQWEEFSKVKNRDYGATSPNYASALNELIAKRDCCINREQLFYSLSKVRNAQEWEKRYLINVDEGLNITSDSTVQQAIIISINSKAVKEALFSKPFDIEKVKSKLDKQIFEQVFTYEDPISREVFEEIISKTIQEAKLPDQRAMIAMLSSKAQQNKGRITSTASKYITNALKDFYKKNFQPTQTEKKINSTNALRTELKRNLTRLETINNTLMTETERQNLIQTIIDAVAEEWELNLNKRNEESRRIKSGAESVVAGQLQEFSKGIAYSVSLDLENQFKDFEISDLFKTEFTIAQKATDKAATRAGRQAKVSSKIDSIFRFADGNGFRIQEKNTVKDISQFKENVFTMPSIHLQGSMLLSNYVNQIDFLLKSNMANNTHQDIQSLIDLLVNGVFYFYVNGQDQNSLNDIYNKGSDIVVKDIQMFMQDYIQTFANDEINITGTEGNDFIIFQDRALIPMSDIYNAIIIALQKEINEGYIKDIKANFEYKGESKFQNNLTHKGYVKSQTKNNEGNYNLYWAAEYGETQQDAENIYQKLAISDISINFNQKTLLDRMVGALRV